MTHSVAQASQRVASQLRGTRRLRVDGALDRLDVDAADAALLRLYTARYGTLLAGPTLGSS